MRETCHQCSTSNALPVLCRTVFLWHQCNSNGLDFCRGYSHSPKRTRLFRRWSGLLRINLYLLLSVRIFHVLCICPWLTCYPLRFGVLFLVHDPRWGRGQKGFDSQVPRCLPAHPEGQLCPLACCPGSQLPGCPYPVPDCKLSSIPYVVIVQALLIPLSHLCRWLVSPGRHTFPWLTRRRRSKSRWQKDYDWGYIFFFFPS